MITKAIIPVAGLGTRFLPATKAQPKEMLAIVDKPVIQYLVEEAVASGITDIIFVTGRGEENRTPTEDWLKKNNVTFEHLFMRALMDRRGDDDVKEDIYHQFIENIYQVLFVVDDRKSVVDRWREMNLICLQCAPGDF